MRTEYSIDVEKKHKIQFEIGLYASCLRTGQYKGEKHKKTAAKPNSDGIPEQSETSLKSEQTTTTKAQQKKKAHTTRKRKI